MTSNKAYSNFVKGSSPQKESQSKPSQNLSGETVKQIYLTEIGDLTYVKPSSYEAEPNKVNKNNKISGTVNNREFFLSIQNNDLDTVIKVLDENPHKINELDDFGWSLLMIACQANAIEVVKELLLRKIDTTTRDKAGNSAQSLVIRNKNSKLAGILLDTQKNVEKEPKQHKIEHKQLHYKCETCSEECYNINQHLVSTVHNLNASKGKKILPCYKIPVNNKGFQLMLKGGWNKDSGLGASGSGIQYPIKSEQKYDRAGLGLKRKKQVEIQNEKKPKYDYKYENYRKRNLEIGFRREFY